MGRRAITPSPSSSDRAEGNKVTGRVQDGDLVLGGSPGLDAYLERVRVRAPRCLNVEVPDSNAHLVGERPEEE